MHGFDPFRIPSAFAMLQGAKQAKQLIERHLAAGNPLPESVALVLWGTDNLKTEGGPIGQALALIGACKFARFAVQRRKRSDAPRSPKGEKRPAASKLAPL